MLAACQVNLTAARALKRAKAHVTLIDRTNHHLFQPLLYQVAMAGLSPADIAAPIRAILRKQKNVSVRLAEATDVDYARRIVTLRDGEISYDYLVIATGSHSVVVQAWDSTGAVYKNTQTLTVQ